jgi:hypothetical protein
MLLLLCVIGGHNWLVCLKADTHKVCLKADTHKNSLLLLSKAKKIRRVPL